MQSVKTWVGVDVSARTLAARRWRDGNENEQVFSNDVAGHQQMVKWVGSNARVCMEATGVYHLLLAMTLHQAEIAVMVVNPRVAKQFAGALSNRSKTDTVDARVLLEFVRKMAFTPWQAPRPSVLELREVGRRLTELTQVATDEKNRLHARSATQLSKVVVQDLKQHLAQLQTRIEKLEAAAMDVIGSDERLREDYDIISKGRGFGRRTTVLLMAELAVLDPTMTTRQIVAHAGLDPRVYESGTSVQKAVRISKVGNARIRAILFMNALSAIRHDKGARLFFARLVARGKKRMQAVVAVMRKLLHGLWTALQKRIAFDGSILFAASLATAESSDSAAADPQPKSSEDHPKGRSEAKELRQQLEPRSTEAIATT